jgi:hypothetical protein
VFKTDKNRVGINRRPTPTSADKKMIFALLKAKKSNQSSQAILLNPFPYLSLRASVCVRGQNIFGFIGVD